MEAALEGPSGPTVQVVDDERDIRVNLLRIGANLGYHAEWQPVAASEPGLFKRANALLAEWRRLSSRPSSEEERRRLAAAVIRFTPASCIRCERGPLGERTLHVVIATDIDDRAFLSAFEDGIERTWNQAPAMQKASLRIVVDWDARLPSALHPEGAPAFGEPIDLKCHRERFDAPLVLTTGAGATHFFDGAIAVGPFPTTRHTLAHELGHSLGFSDGYLRAHDGSPDDPEGVVFVELTGLGADLMSMPATGSVTDDMVRLLTEAYCR